MAYRVQFSRDVDGGHVVSNLKNAARRALSANRPRAALTCYLQLETLEAMNGDWPRRASMLHVRLGEPKLAVRAGERAAEKYAERGFWLKAVASCGALVRLDPTNEKAARMLERFEHKASARSGVDAVERCRTPDQLSSRRDRAAARTNPPLTVTILGRVRPRRILVPST